MKPIFNTRREAIEDFEIINYPRLDGMFNFHSPIELLLVRQGKCRVWINDSEAELHTGELAVALSFDTHRFLSSENGVYTILFISPSMCPAFAEAVRCKSAHNPVVRDADTVKRITESIDRLRGGQINHIEQMGYISVILGALLDRLDLEIADQRTSDALPTRLFFYINEHYKEDISVKTIAQAMGYDRHYLSKNFRTSFQMSIKSYIHTLRLKNAVMMMQSPSNSITKCAMESGFGSMRTFYRAFVAEFGYTPREYIKHL